jgi:DNA-binding transcriptional MerR regulator
MGGSAPQPAKQRALSTAEVARILGVEETRVRAWVRSGLCRPARRGRGWAFAFQDLVVLRAAQGLLAKRVPPARVRRALSLLAAQLPAGRPLSGLRVRADGRRVSVSDRGARWEPETGQTLFDFETDALERRMDDVAPAAAGPPPAVRAKAEFQRGLELEDDDPGAARDAYAAALRLDPGLVDAYVNLGRLAHEAGDAREAARLYHLALERSPDDSVVHFNLALALEDTTGAAAAAAHYERALDLDPGFADAHYNLAGLCEQMGRRADALRHYREYQKLTSGG